jgi:hypothetical protein
MEESQMLLMHAIKERKSVSCAARELILEALESCEDKILSEIGDARFQKSLGTFPHEKVWKNQN